MIFDQTENSELFDLADRLGLYDGMRRFQTLVESGPCDTAELRRKGLEIRRDLTKFLIELSDIEEEVKCLSKS